MFYCLYSASQGETGCFPHETASSGGGYTASPVPSQGMYCTTMGNLIPGNSTF